MAQKIGAKKSLVIKNKWFIFWFFFFFPNKNVVKNLGANLVLAQKYFWPTYFLAKKNVVGLKKKKLGKKKIGHKKALSQKKNLPKKYFPK